jgi:nitrogen fixation/metabolism regulation signal transduction histidine kinase
MTKNPFYNALAAVGYITLVVSLMTWATSNSGPDKPFFAPLAALSLLTLSVAVMSYVFFYEPFKMYFDNQKDEAIRLFIKTVGIFGVITFLILIFVFWGVDKLVDL